MKIKTLCCVSAILFGGQSALATENVVDKTVPTCDYTKLTIDVPATVKLVAKGELAGHVKGINKELDTLKYTCADGEFKIDSEPQISPTKAFVFEFANGSISSVTLNGAQQADISELTAKSFTLVLNGASNSLLHGKVGDFNVRLNGSGQVEASELTSQKAKIDVNGSGLVRLNVDSELKGLVNGSGRIEYLGHPQSRDTNVIGSGSIVAQTN